MVNKRIWIDIRYFNCPTIKLNKCKSVKQAKVNIVPPDKQQLMLHACARLGDTTKGSDSDPLPDGVKVSGNKKESG